MAALLDEIQTWKRFLSGTNYVLWQNFIENFRQHSSSMLSVEHADVAILTAVAPWPCFAGIQQL